MNIKSTAYVVLCVFLQNNIIFSSYSPANVSRNSTAQSAIREDRESQSFINRVFTDISQSAKDIQKLLFLFSILSPDTNQVTIDNTLYQKIDGIWQRPNITLPKLLVQNPNYSESNTQRKLDN